MTNLNLVTVTDFQLYAPEIDLSAYTPDTISGMISQASQRVADILDYTPLAEDITAEIAKGRISTRGDLVIYPAKVPVQSFSSLEIMRGATSITVTLVNSNNVPKYNVDYQKRKIVYPYEEITLEGTPVFTDFFSLRHSEFLTRISYRGGFEVSELPGTIKQATILIVRDILSYKHNIAGANRISQGGITLDYNSQNGSTDSKFMKEAKALLASYVR